MIASPASATATVINVPADQPTIQAAVSAAASGDTILLAPGTYTGGVWVQDKALTFASWYQTTGDPAYIGQTVISGYVANACGGASGCVGNAVLEFGSRAGGSVVNGLTVENGVDGVRGNARVTVSHSTMTGNSDGADFGNDSTALFDHDVFIGNTDDGIDLNGRVAMTLVDSTVQQNQGDGIEFRMYPYVGPMLDVVIRRNRFVRNDSDGIQLIDSDGASSRTLTIDRNVFDHNGAASVGCLPNQQTNEDFSGAPLAERVYITNNTFSGENYGIVGGANSIVLNNIFAGTLATALRRVGGASTSAYNLFWHNAVDYEDSVVDPSTSVFEDPLLYDDFRLWPGSPAIDAGTSSYTWNGEQVLTVPASDYSGTAPDLGYWEYAGAPPNRAPGVSAGPESTVGRAGVARPRAAFTSATKPSTRALTTAATAWTPTPWTLVSEAGANQRTPDLSSVLQEIVSRPGWAGGNAVALIITGTGHRTARAYEGKPAGAPLLHLEYKTGGPPPNHPPAVNAGPDQTLTLPGTASLDATVTDDGLPTGSVSTHWSQVSGPGATSFGDASAVDTSAGFSVPGTYVLQLTASDGQLTASDTAQVIVQPAPTPGAATLERRISASTDDVEESATGSYYATSSDLELVFDGSDQKVGLRFPGLTVPAGAKITKAYLQFETDETQSDATSLSIHGQATDNALAFTSATKPSTRVLTTAAIAWAPGPWTLVGETGAGQRTPDLSAVVQEIVSRPGWAAGNAVVLIVSGTGHRTARAYDGKPAGAPLLHLEYTTG